MTEPPASGPGAVPDERPPARVGLFLCRCAGNLGALIRLEELGDPGRWPGVARVATHDLLCSPAGRDWLRAELEAGRLDRAVVAACSPREHGATFRGVLRDAGRSPSLLQMVNLREQVEWIGGDPEAATLRATRLVRAGIARVGHHRHREVRRAPVTADVLVVGGGAAGLSAALTLARDDRRVILVEREAALGGLAARLDAVFPDGACASCFMEPALDAALHHPRIEVLTRAGVARVRGAAGRFQVELDLAPRHVDPERCLGCGRCAAACPVELPDPWAAGLARRRAAGPAYPGSLPHVSSIDPACPALAGGACRACEAACPAGAIRLDAAAARRTVEVGAIVVATGLVPGAVEGPPGLVGTFALERMLHPDGPTGGRLAGPGGEPPRTVLLATTAAETDGALGAREVLKLAGILRARHPAVAVAVAGGLGRAPGLAATARAAALAGVELLAAELLPDGLAPAGDGAGVAVRLADGLLEEVRRFDLVAVHAPVTPPPGAAALAALLRLPLDARGFVEEGAAGPFEPSATRVAGILVAGGAAGPRPIREAIRDGAAAAGRILSTLVAGGTLEVEPLAAEVDAGRCGGCAICVAACPFAAVALDPATGRARVEPLHCRACGSCVAACPTGAADAPGFTRAELAAEISALLAGEG